MNNEYVARVLDNLKKLYPNETEYLQSVQAWLEMIEPAVDDPRYEKMDLLTRMVEPERMFSFLVPWVDDKGVAHTNHGYRVQFNSAIGPYKGACASIPVSTLPWSSSWALSRPSRMPSPACQSAARAAAQTLIPEERATVRSCASARVL